MLSRDDAPVFFNHAVSSRWEQVLFGLLSFYAMTRDEKLKFYHSAQWKQMRKYILARDHYECMECRRKLSEGKTNKIRRARLVHHIIPFEVDPSLALDEDNLISLCDGCHNHIHGRDGRLLPKKPAKKYVTEEMW